MNVTGETRGRKLCIRRANAPTRSLIVPRYLFRFSSGKEFVPDNVGTELPNLKAAHLHAVELIDNRAVHVGRFRLARLAHRCDGCHRAASTHRPFHASSATGADGLWAAFDQEHMCF